MTKQPAKTKEDAQAKRIRLVNERLARDFNRILFPRNGRYPRINAKS